MVEKVLMSGNESIGRGAILAGCQLFFGYPITPQSEIMEYMSRELPKAGGVFLQAECELATAGMVSGAASTGTRAMSATSSPGTSLMAEFCSHMSFSMIPAVLVDVCRFGPGIGTGQTSQTDYNQLTKGAGHGGYRSIVLAPYSAQECLDLIQLAFWLADNYRMLVYVLTEFTTGQSIEPVEPRTLEFEPLPEKDWAARGRDARGGKPPPVPVFGDLVGYHLHQIDKYKKIEETEVRYDTYQADDADILLVAYGYVARMAEGAVDMCRAQGLKVGLLRPITLWPFPSTAIDEAGSRAKALLVVEHSSGLMVDDVKFAVLGKVPVHLLGIWGTHLRGGSGLIYPERIVEEVKNIL